MVGIGDGVAEEVGAVDDTTGGVVVGAGSLSAHWVSSNPRASSGRAAKIRA